MRMAGFTLAVSGMPRHMMAMHMLVFMACFMLVLMSMLMPAAAFAMHMFMLMVMLLFCFMLMLMAATALVMRIFMLMSMFMHVLMFMPAGTMFICILLRLHAPGCIAAGCFCLRSLFREIPRPMLVPVHMPRTVAVVPARTAGTVGRMLRLLCRYIADMFLNILRRVTVCRSTANIFQIAHLFIIHLTSPSFIVLYKQLFI